MSTETLFKKEITIGRCNNGKINVTLELRLKKGNFETVDHMRIGRYVEVSLTGDEYTKNWRGWVCGGQIVDALDLSKLKPTSGKQISYRDARFIRDMWKTGHLNGMRPNCIHQESFNCNCGDFEQKAAIESAKCPNGYKYGSKWLVKEIDRAALERLKSIFEKYPEA